MSEPELHLEAYDPDRQFNTHYVNLNLRLEDWEKS